MLCRTSLAVVAALLTASCSSSSGTSSSGTTTGATSGAATGTTTGATTGVTHGSGASSGVASGTTTASASSSGASTGASSTSGTAASGATSTSGATSGTLPTPDAGDVLIADQFNNRVVELNPVTKQIVWSFGDGTPVAGLTSVVAPNDAERVDGNLTLISGTGAPAGTEPLCDAGCTDNRVLLVDPAGHIVWQYGNAGVADNDAGNLNTPVCAVRLPNGNVLITDQANNRIIEVQPSQDAGGTIVWDYGESTLNSPNSAERLANGNTLIADELNNRVLEVDAGGNVVWGFPANGTQTDAGLGPQLLNTVAFASRLPNGDTLITDSANSRILEVDDGGNTVWQYVTNARSGSVTSPLPTRAVRTSTGLTLISDQFNDQVIEVDDGGNVVFSVGAIGVADNDAGFLNGPYDAKIIGDFTGLTPPPGF